MQNSFQILSIAMSILHRSWNRDIVNKMHIKYVLHDTKIAHEMAAGYINTSLIYTFSYEFSNDSDAQKDLDKSFFHKKAGLLDAFLFQVRFRWWIIDFLET